MKLHYMGKYNLNPESLPHGEHIQGAVAFKEPKDSKSLGKIASIISFIILFFLLIFWIVRCGERINLLYPFIASILATVMAIPHELLHALCFKEDVYLYTDLRHGLIFITCPEVISKRRYIFMSLLPNVVFGLAPYAMAMINPDLVLLGLTGGFLVAMGAGDYINVFNALTQMPKGSKTYLYGFNSYWFVP